MKKFTALILIVFITQCCTFAQQDPYYEQEQTEIHLDVNTPAREYNLNKTDLRNNPKIEPPDEDEMPINFMQVPMQLLKQYQNDKL